MEQAVSIPVYQYINVMDKTVRISTDICCCVHSTEQVIAKYSDVQLRR